MKIKAKLVEKSREPSALEVNYVLNSFYDLFNEKDEIYFAILDFGKQIIYFETYSEQTEHYKLNKQKYSYFSKHDYYLGCGDRFIVGEDSNEIEIPDDIMSSFKPRVA